MLKIVAFIMDRYGEENKIHIEATSEAFHLDAHNILKFVIEELRLSVDHRFYLILGINWDLRHARFALAHLPPQIIFHRYEPRI